jgi:hypothetical protein
MAINSKINRSAPTGAPWELTASDWNTLWDQVQMVRQESYGPIGDNSTVLARASLTARTLADRFGETANVLDFGADPTGVADSTVAIQSAIDSIKPPFDTFDSIKTDPAPFAGTMGRVVFPKGQYLVSQPLDLWSGITFEGDNKNGSILLISASFSGTCVVRGSGIGGNYLVNAGMIHMGCAYAAGVSKPLVWVYQSAANVVAVNNYFRNLHMWNALGFDLRYYAQANTIEDVESHGTCDQILHLQGNMNKVSRVTKEGSSGSTTDPFIYIENHAVASPSDPLSGQNVLKDIILEGACSVNKPMMRLDGTAGTTLENLWFEPATATNGNALEIAHSVNVRWVGGPAAFYQPYTKLSVTDTSTVYIDAINASNEDLPLSSCVTVDATSRLRLGVLYCRRNENLWPMFSNIKIGTAVPAALLFTPDNVTRLDAEEPIPATNILLNPSFEAGTYAWQVLGTVTPVVEASSLLSNALQLKITGSGDIGVYQAVSLKKDQVYTLSAWVKLTGAGVILPLAPSLSTGVNKISATGEWYFLTASFTCDADYTSNEVGLTLYGADGTTTLLVDEFSLCPGPRALSSVLRAPDIQLGYGAGVRTILMAGAAPTTGTWKHGDIAFTVSPVAAGWVGWVCVAGGSPGTWKAFGGIAA